jgi:hypothetical protein
VLGHVGIDVPDLRAVKTYYEAIMPLLGFEKYLDAEDQFAYPPFGGKPGTYLCATTTAPDGQCPRTSPMGYR